MKEKSFDPTYWYLGILHDLRTEQQCIDHAVRVMMETESVSPLVVDMAGLLQSEKDRVLHFIAESSELDRRKSLQDYRDQFARDAVEQYLSGEIPASQLERLAAQLCLEVYRSATRGSRGLADSLYDVVTDWDLFVTENELRDQLVCLLTGGAPSRWKKW